MLGTALATAGCQTTGTAGTDVSCRAFEPITWSKSDTRETVREVRGHNAAWAAICAKRGAARVAG